MLARGYQFRFLHKPCAIEIAEGCRQENQSKERPHSFQGCRKWRGELDAQDQLPSTNAYCFSRSLDDFRDKYPVVRPSARENDVGQASYDAVGKGANGCSLLPAKFLNAQSSHSLSRELTSGGCQSPLKDTRLSELNYENPRLRRSTSCPQLGRICTRFSVEILEEAYLREQAELYLVSRNVCADWLVFTAMESLEEYRQLEWSMEMLIAYPEECSYMFRDLSV